MMKYNGSVKVLVFFFLLSLLDCFLHREIVGGLMKMMDDTVMFEIIGKCFQEYCYLQFGTLLIINL